MNAKEQATALDLGALLIQSGLATRQQIDECLALQRECELEGRTAPRLGELLVRKGVVRPEQVIHLLQRQRMEIRFCPRCGIRVNVQQRSDAAAYQCSRCRGPLVPPPLDGGLEAEDESFIVVSRDPLPPEVEAVRHDPTRKFGKYIIVREIGRGGVGLVDLAWDTFLSQPVALKRIIATRKGDDTRIRESRIKSLVKEARNTIKLRHPGIVSVFDVGRIGQEFYMSMEYLEGDTLLDRINAAKASGSVSPYFDDPRVILRILGDMARAVHYAHSRPVPVVHCDLKPANILIDPQGRPHVLDFGLARSLRMDIDEEGDISGTPSYMAPEQVEGQAGSIDARADIFAFGSILYELLTGRPTFLGSPVEVLYRTVSESPSPPSEVIRRGSESGVSTRRLLQIPRRLEQLCMRCLDRDRDKRPSSMEEVAVVLEELYGPATGGGGTRSDAPATRRLPEEVAVAAALAAFRPEAALEAAEAAERRTLGGKGEQEARAIASEARRVAALKRALVDALSNSPPSLPELRLRDRSVRPAVILHADGRGLTVGADGTPIEVSWPELEPSQIVSLIWQATGEPSGSGRLALAIYCMRAGRVGEAKDLLEALRDGEQAEEAAVYVKRLEDPGGPI